MAASNDGQPAAPSLVRRSAASRRAARAAAGGDQDCRHHGVQYGYWAVSEPCANGAYFLGELGKFVHVAPQRFERIAVAGSGPCGLTVGVKGSPGEEVRRSIRMGSCAWPRMRSRAAAGPTWSCECVILVPRA